MEASQRVAHVRGKSRTETGYWLLGHRMTFSEQESGIASPEAEAAAVSHVRFQ